MTNVVISETRNAGYVVRAAMHAHDAAPGLLAETLVAAEDPGRGAWVTWAAYDQEGRLTFNAGHYFTGGDSRANRRAALADLAVRAGLVPEIARHIAGQITGYVVP